MKRPAVALLAGLLAAWPAAARAEDANAGDADDEPVPKDLGDLILDTGRPPVSKAEPDVVRLQIHGEYQLRITGLGPLAFDPTATALDATPGLVDQPLGQRAFASHWLRLTPRLQIRDNLEIIGQVDLVTGLLLGDLAREST